jgi:hypothetical protein
MNKLREFYKIFVVVFIFIIGVRQGFTTWWFPLLSASFIFLFMGLEGVFSNTKSKKAQKQNFINEYTMILQHCKYRKN